MSKRNPKHLEEYPLFYEELARDRDRNLERAVKDTIYERAASLSEREVAKLSDDLRRPMKDPSSETNPLQ